MVVAFSTTERMLLGPGRRDSGAGRGRCKAKVYSYCLTERFLICSQRIFLSGFMVSTALYIRPGTA